MKRTQVKFKPYQQNQLMAFPMTFDEKIPANHVVRVVNHVIDAIDINPLIKKYKAGGCTSYHPRMLLKIIVYAYLNNIYSSRKIEAAVNENIFFMWLAGMDTPDHNTINRFRSDRLKGVIKKVFTQVVLLMVESGHVDLQSVYTDGTKLESKANRYTFVWGKRVNKSIEKIKNQLEELWNYSQQVAAEELKDTAPTNFEELDPAQVQRTIEKIDEALKNKPVDKEIKKKIRHAKKNWAKNLERYESEKETLNGRNSFAKTDPDATFMRMKEDHLKNGQLKPAYNVQISTNEQVITHFSIHQNPGDTRTLRSHLESFKNELGQLPKELTADAGYGSEENYLLLQENNIDAYVKYNYFDKENKQQDKAKSPFHQDNLSFDADKNCYYCPMGQQMQFIGTTNEISEYGFEKTIHHYQAKNCTGCKLRGACHKNKGNRVIGVNHRLNELKSKARELLQSDMGIVHRKKRSVDVEPVFGFIKQNMGFRRFMLAGMNKVNIEFGLLAIAHNIKKILAKGLSDKGFLSGKGFFAKAEAFLTEFSMSEKFIPIHKPI